MRLPFVWELPDPGGLVARSGREACWNMPSCVCTKRVAPTALPSRRWAEQQVLQRAEPGADRCSSSWERAGGQTSCRTENGRLRRWWLVAVKWKQVRPVFLQKQMPQQFKLNFLWQIFIRFGRKFFYTHIIVLLRKTNLLHFSRPNPPNCFSYFLLLCCYSPTLL